MRLTVCDRCGGELQDPTDAGALVCQSPPGSHNVESLDLCPACYEKFESWLKMESVAPPGLEPRRPPATTGAPASTTGSA